MIKIYQLFKKYFKDYYKYLLLLNCFFSIYIILGNNLKRFSPYKPNIENIKIGNGSYAKIGIINDFHLDYYSEQNGLKIFFHFSHKLNLALKYFKDNKIDLLIIAGDITNNGLNKNFLYFKKIFFSVYNNNSKPLIISLMGNHDFSELNFSENEKKKFFYKLPIIL